jgi:hypothetical protein
VDALRDIFTDLMDLPEVNRYLSRLLSGVGHHYPLPYPTAHPAAGTHCPPLTIDDTVALDRLTTSGRPLLLHPQAKRVQAGDQVDAVTIDKISADLFTAVLLRPDGVLAWAAAPGDDLQSTALQQALHTWFPRAG